MKILFGILFFLNAGAAHAACPNIPVEWNVKSFSYIIPTVVSGDITVTASIPELTKHDCEEFIDTRSSYSRFEFKLKNAAVTLTFKSNALGKTLQTLKYTDVEMYAIRGGASGDRVGFEISIPHKQTFDNYIFSSERIEFYYLGNPKTYQYDVTLNGRTRPQVIKILSRW